MTMNWLGMSEVVTGFILRKKLDPNAVNPDDLYPPYNQILPLARDGLEMPDIVTKAGYSAVRSAIEASEAVNGDMSPLQWVKTLQMTASKATSGAVLARVAKDLQEGRDVDTGTALAALSRIDTGYRAMTPMSEVTDDEDVWVKTGWQPLDKHVGGIVKAGLVVVGASPGVGKTTLALKIVSSMVKKYKKSKGAFFSLEMTMGQLAKRARELDKSLTKDEKARILISDSSFSVNEVYAEAAKLAASEHLSIIAVDFADLLVEGEQSEAVMGAVYRTLAMLAKKTGVPVLLISQLSRATYQGGIPKVNHLRYSGMAEAMSALILLIYNPNNILAEFAADNTLTAVPGKGYLLVGKSRFGFKEGGPGGIQIDWDGLGGWGETSSGYFNITV